MESIPGKEEQNVLLLLSVRRGIRLQLNLARESSSQVIKQLLHAFKVEQEW